MLPGGMLMLRDTLLLFLVVVSWAGSLVAQEQDSLRILPAPDSKTPSRLGPGRDSMELDVFPVLQPWRATAFQGPDLENLRRYDPVDQPRGTEWARLHNLGTAARPLVPTLPRHIGFQAWSAAYDPYILNADSLQMIRSALAWSDVYYAQGPTSEDGLFKGTLARRFGKGTDFQVEALRIYNQGAYQRLGNRHSSLRAALRYQSPSDRYSITLLHGNHVLDQQENGGIRTDTLLGDPFFQARVNVPVWLNQARFRLRETDHQIVQQQALRGTVSRESLGRIVLQHRLRWQKRRYLFSDTAPPPDPADFYGPFLTDLRGLRHFTSWNTLSNQLAVLTSLQNSRGDGLSWQGGIEHRGHRWNNEYNQGKLNNLLLLSSLDMRWRDMLDLHFHGEMDFGDQAGAWMLQGQAGLNTGNWGRLDGGLIFQRRHPDLFQEQLAVSQRLVYQRSWEVPQHQCLWGQLDLKRWGLAAGWQLHLLSRALYFDAEGLPDQITGTLSQQQLWVSHQLHLGSFHLIQRVSSQTSTDNRLPFPAWITRHDGYYEGWWFRRSLRIRMGAEARLISPWTPLAYMPLHGAFHVQDQAQDYWFPQLDLYLAIERMGFRLFVEWENAGQSLFGWKSTAANGQPIPRVFSTVHGYPMPENWLRFGAAFTFRG